MGNREDLLAAAKRCLYERGYARTTARDIATAAGTSLAAIGYHFGSKDALLNEARIQAIAEWYDELGRALAASSEPDATPMERFEAIWTRMIEVFGAHRALCVYSFVHRGTPERPGLVLGLDRGGTCRGIAFREDAAERTTTLAYLRGREQVTKVYRESLRSVWLNENPQQRVQALCYVVSRARDELAGRDVRFQVVASGRHADLVAADGPYAQLIAAQRRHA